MKLSQIREFRLNVRLDDCEYDAVFQFAKLHRCESLAAAVRMMIKTACGGAAVVPLTRSGERLQ